MPRLCTLSSPLGDRLLFSQMEISEQLSQPFVARIRALSSRGDIASHELLGKPAGVRIEHADGTKRFVHGYVTRMSLGGSDGRHFVYELVLRPWLWFLTRTSDCRIFQSMTVPDIVRNVFADEQSSELEAELHGSYADWSFCVQYRETDFNFVSRLLEQEGIAYVFEHEDGRHSMRLFDDSTACKDIDGEGTLRYAPDAAARGIAAPVDTVHSWNLSEEIQPSRYAMGDFDYLAPGNDLSVVRNASLPPDHVRAGLEIYDFPGEYGSFAEGEAYAAFRIEELNAQAKRYQGQGALKCMQPGRKFRLAGHGRRDLNKEYLVISTEYHYQDPPFESGTDSGSNFHCSFVAIDARQPYRPPRNTPKPSAPGMQTATVVGPPGDEIHTDEHGRIRVKFRWDRSSVRDETASCWIRVAYPFAGSRFGFVAVPRIGQEVVVQFEEGDPDRPLVVGSVYNGENAPPWKLPENMTQSGVLTRSSTGGGLDNANALRFDDKTGAEEVWLHAEKDLKVEVENDETRQIGNSRTTEISKDDTLTVGGKLSASAGSELNLKAGTSTTQTSGTELSIDAGTNITVNAGMILTLKAGPSTIELGPAGITIKGPLVQIN